MKKKILLSILVITLVSVGIITFILKYEYSKGVRSGNLVKISKKGVLLKTYEGTLDLGSGDLLTWDFSVHDQELGRQLEAVSGQKVRLEYREMFFRLFYNTKYEVTAWQLVEEQGSTRLLCRLVQVLIKNKFVVERVRPMIREHDPELLELMKECQ